MKITKIHLLIVVFTLLVLSCNNKEDKTKAPQNMVTDKNSKTEKHSTFNSPCDLISMEEVKSMFAVVGHPIDMKDVVYTHPTCVFKWVDGKVTISRSFGGQEIKSSMPSEVLIVMVKEANERMFNTSVKVYKDGLILSGIGEMAMWSQKMDQLSFLSNNYLFHVHVRVSNNDDQNKEKAIEVSKLILKKLKK